MNGDPGLGLSAGLILSQRWDMLTLHVNEVLVRSRLGNADAFAGVILEGPFRWIVRPVAEAFVEREASVATTASVLAGAILRARDNLTLDVAGRTAWIDGVPLYEMRTGFTWAFPFVGTP